MERAAFDLEAGNDNDSSGFANKPLHRKPCPLVKPAAGVKERYGEMVCQVSKVAATILTQLAQELPRLRSGVIAQCDFLGSEIGALGERICSTKDVIEQRKGCFNLEVTGGASTASYLLVELPCPVFWQGLENKAFGSCPRDRISQVRR